jgi:hypothetical protein
LSKNRLGERAGIKTSQHLLGDVEPFQVDRGSAHAQQPRDRGDAVAQGGCAGRGHDYCEPRWGILLAVQARRGHWQVRAMAEMWLGTLLILGINLVLVGLLCAIIFVATTGLGRWQDRRQARRFAEAAARGDFEEAETVVRAASHQAGRTDLVV